MLRPSLLLCALCFVGLLKAQLPIPTNELDYRIQLSVDRLTDQSVNPAFNQAFILADVNLQANNPRRFDNFSGDLSGRYIEVMSLLSEQEREVAHLDELVAAVLKFQQPDGRFGDPDLQFTAEAIGGEHMALLWGNGRLLLGLMTYYEQTEDQTVLAAASRLGDFFISTMEACRQPAVVEKLAGLGAHGIICFTQYIEGLVPLAQATSEERFVEAAASAYQIMPERGIQHSHGYLTTLRGALMLHELTGNPEQLDYVRRTFDDLLASEDYTLYGAVFEYFGGHGERDEGCSSADFMRLAFHLYQLTDELHYLEVAEAALLNALYLNQHEQGDFGNRFYAEFGLDASNPRRAWWCCTMHGLRALLAVKEEFLFNFQQNRVTMSLWLNQRLVREGMDLEIRQLSPENGRERWQLTFNEWPAKSFKVRLPSWGQNWQILQNGDQTSYEPGFLIIADPDQRKEITFSTQMRLAFLGENEDQPSLELPARPQSGYLFYGPYLMGIHQADFIAEPDWGHQVALAELQPDPDRANCLQTQYRNSGYPGLLDLQLVPVGQQLYFGHPYTRVKTGYGLELKVGN
ncbi:MAG: beta-L-arabinofuranosidase domain-containing protein [Bacteroidota bacterium]